MEITLFSIKFSGHYIFIEDSRKSQKFIQDQFDKFLNDQSSYDAIKFVGDKRPGASYMLEVNDRLFSFDNKKLLYLHLYRDPFPTALSWEKRAADKRDPWPTRWGAEMMAKHFISQAKIALKLHKSSQLKSTYIKFVDYDRFSSGKHYCAKLFDFIKDYLGQSDLKTFQGSQPVANFVESNRDFVNNRSCHTLESFSEPSRLLRKSRNIYRKLRRYDS